MKKSPQLTISFREVGTFDESEKDYLAHIGKFIIEFSKVEHILDEAIVAALNYDKKTITSLSRTFPNTMDAKLKLMADFCISCEGINKFSIHLQNRLKELDRAMSLRNTLCHGYLDLVKIEGSDTEFRFTRWKRGDNKFHIQSISTMPRLSQIKKSTKALYVWKALFSELERSLQRLLKSK